MAGLTPNLPPDILPVATRPSLLSGGGGAVSVRGYTRVRNGQRESVRTHQRSDPPGGEGEERGGEAPRLVPYSASTEEQVRVWLAAKSRDPTDPDGRRRTILEGGVNGAGGGGGPRGTSASPQQAPAARPPPPPMPPAEAARLRQELRDIAAPNGVPLGSARHRSDPATRGIESPNPRADAEALFERLTSGRGGRDITGPGHAGRLLELPDGSTIGIRYASRSGTPTVDVNVAESGTIFKFHFNLGRP